MDLEEIFITVESKINKLLYNSDINYMEFYTYLYNTSIKIQQIKSPSIRVDTIKFYYAVYDKIKESINSYIVNIYEKIIDNKSILQTYSIELNIFNDNLEIINNLIEYFNNELTKIDINYSKIDYFVYGMKKWYENITIKLIPFINESIKQKINYKEYGNNGVSILEIDEDIYYINELLENIYYCSSNKIIESNIFEENIGNEVYIYLEKTVCENSKIIKYSPNFLTFINKLNEFYTKQLELLNLENLLSKYNKLFHEKIIMTNDHLIKVEFYNLLYNINIDTFKLEYSIEIDKIVNLNYCLNYCYDNEFIQSTLNKWIDSYSITDFASILDLIYLTHLLYIKLQEIDQSTKLESIYNTTLYLYTTYLPNDKSVIEKFDKYIREYLYKKINIPLESFYNSLSLYFTNYIEEDILFVYYKSFLIKRLNRYNFNSDYIEIEINIIEAICYKLNTPNLHKLNIIKNDLIASKSYSHEFNTIYNRECNLIISTDGIWNIQPKTYDFTNTYFNTILNEFTLEFSSFYNCKYQNKKLDWNYDTSSCVLNYNINSEKSIDIDCPLKYANILCEFNDNDRYKSDNKGIIKYCNELVKYGILKLNNSVYVLNTNIKQKNITIKHVLTKLKTIKKSQKREIVFTKKELAELFIIRSVKRVNCMSEEQIIESTRDKYDIETSLIHKILDKCIDNQYLSKEDNNYFYII